MTSPSSTKQASIIIIYLVPRVVKRRLTLVVGVDTAWNLDAPSTGNIAGRRLQKEERLLGHSIVELLDMSSIVPADSNNLETGLRVSGMLHSRNAPSSRVS
jgi:hypothetical protein